LSPTWLGPEKAFWKKKNGGLGLWEQGLEKDSNLCYLKES
jgi:hypothetical protein